MKQSFVPLLAMTVSACAGSYQYTKPDLSDVKAASEVVMVCDYLGITDDVGDLWDFDEDRNRKYAEFYGTLIMDALIKHGYSLSSTYLSSSGLGVLDAAPVDYYVGGKKQDSPVTLPMIWESRGLSEPEIAALQELFDELVNHVAWIPNGEIWLDDYAELNFAEFLEPLEIEDDTLILVASMAKPRVSIGKGVGGAMLSSTVTLGLTGGDYVSYPVHYAYEGTAAFLLHKGTGELIWKNFYPTVHGKREKAETFFAGFPSAGDQTGNSSRLSAQE